MQISVALGNMPLLMARGSCLWQDRMQTIMTSSSAELWHYLVWVANPPSMSSCTLLLLKENGFFSTALNKVCGLTWVTSSWLPKRNIDAEFFKRIFGTMGTTRQTNSIILERRHISTNKLILQEEKSVFDFGLNCPIEGPMSRIWTFQTLALPIVVSWRTL